MKRQKRDRLERAQARGYQAGLNGRSSETCPVGVKPEKIYNKVSLNNPLMVNLI